VLSSTKPEIYDSGWLPATRLSQEPDERFLRRRVGLIWALLFINVLSYQTGETIIHIPSVLGKLITQACLAAAFVLALTLNRKLIVRPNTLLTLYTILAVAALMVSVRDEVSVIGTDYRALRLLIFVATLWLLTPWWGRQDMLMLRCQMRALVIVLATVIVGMMIAPGKAFSFQGRLSGTIWSIPPTQVAHYAAAVAGMSAVLWLGGLLKRNWAIIFFVGGIGIIILTHTRTALIALLIGILVAALSMFKGRKRVRTVFLTLFIFLLLTGVVLLPALTHWFSRGQSSQEFSQLTGRTVVWGELVNAPRPIDNIIFGQGLSNDSFNGLSIDDSWLSVYLDQGLVGDVLVALIMVSLIIIAAFRPRGPDKAVALFLLVYCLIASLTETGLGQASTYLLDLTIAASLMVPRAPKLLEARGAMA
jgi:O-Antigen ligase